MDAWTATPGQQDNVRHAFEFRLRRYTTSSFSTHVEVGGSTSIHYFEFNNTAWGHALDGIAH